MVVTICTSLSCVLIHVLYNNQQVKGERHRGHPTVTRGGRGDPSPGKKGAQKETRKEKGERHHDHPTGMGGGRGDPSPGNKKARPSRNKMGDTFHELFCHDATTPSGESN